MGVVVVVWTLCDPECPRFPVDNVLRAHGDVQTRMRCRMAKMKRRAIIKRASLCVGRGRPTISRKNKFSQISVCFISAGRKTFPMRFFSCLFDVLLHNLFFNARSHFVGPHPLPPLPPPGPQTATYCFNLCHRKYFSKLEGETFWIMNLRWPARE